MNLQQEYVISVIYGHTKRPKYLKANKTYNFECPVCNEGKSAGKKRRGFYIPAQDIVHCHNCDWHSRPAKWIQQVTGKSYRDVCIENSEFFSSADATINFYNKTSDTSAPKRACTLPEDSINLLALEETTYYKSNTKVQGAIKYIRSRRLHSAKHCPKAIYYSIKDKIYPDAVCFPFFNISNKIDYFQVRELDPKAKSKYRGSLGDKTLFNVNKVDPEFLYIFLFEGPIDAMFIKNAVAMAGTNLTAKQESQLNMFPLHKRIWCLDNQRVDETSRKLTLKLLDKGESVFVWPEKYKRFKDINELCCEFELNEISTSFIIDNTYSTKMQLIAAGVKL